MPVVDRFEMLKCWVNAAEFTGLQVLGQHAIIPFPVTTTVAEGSFSILKGFLEPDRQYMDPETQIGYLLCMVNGDVSECIPQWARE